MHLVAQVQEIEENPVGVARMKNWSMTACCYGGASRMHIYETDVWPSKGHHSYQVKQGISLQPGMVIDIHSWMEWDHYHVNDGAHTTREPRRAQL